MNAILITSLICLFTNAYEGPALTGLQKHVEVIEQKLSHRKLTQSDVAQVKVADEVVIFRRHRLKEFDDVSLIRAIVSGVVKMPDGQATIYLDSAQSPPITDGLVLTLEGKLVGQILGEGSRIQVRPAVAFLK